MVIVTNNPWPETPSEILQSDYWAPSTQHDLGAWPKGGPGRKAGLTAIQPRVLYRHTRCILNTWTITDNLRRRMRWTNGPFIYVDEAGDLHDMNAVIVSRRRVRQQLDRSWARTYIPGRQARVSRHGMSYGTLNSNTSDGGQQCQTSPYGVIAPEWHEVVTASKYRVRSIRMAT